MRKLDHINIVKYVDFIRTPSHINIVLEFIEGGSLAVILKKVRIICCTSALIERVHVPIDRFVLVCISSDLCPKSWQHDT